jgi:hypothetical protein
VLLNLILSGVFPVIECVAPEVAQPGAQFAQSLRARAVQAASAGTPFGNEARLAQDAQVLGDGWPGDLREMRGNLSRGAFDIAHQAQDRASARIGEGIEDGAVQHALI